MRVSRLVAFWFGILGFGLPMNATAQDAGLTPTLSRLDTQIAGLPITVARNGPACPPACLQPMEAAPGVTPMGEAELVAFLAGPAAEMQGIVVDARSPEDHAQGTLPGAISLPGATLRSDNPYRAELLAALGLAPGRSPEHALVVFGQGPLDPAPVAALRALYEAGYPQEKLHYYRGGLDVWTALGLTVGPGS
ncbi:Rhodanese-like domain protein [Roseivivax sp. THAF40]|uniref:rhodanese-like domain-containing protein n=1 Tax=unclassified Roseivivax TaxID=2639302 RepID=UPI0012689AE9|nr:MULTISPECIES: rhodanese-like domain-containing protein [unclassified Roseivivax]QFS81448.1 Rhodanese-like domain protein [Roseivivax sp. THAF197b]QFT45177.1 Rhodanese-like domain protein [Roseivivax sp. THAF40]